MLFLGHADKDLRCVRFRHCRDHTPDLAQVNLAKFDGITEQTDHSEEGGLLPDEAAIPTEFE